MFDVVIYTYGVNGVTEAGGKAHLSNIRNASGDRVTIQCAECLARIGPEHDANSDVVEHVCAAKPVVDGQQPPHRIGEQIGPNRILGNTRAVDSHGQTSSLPDMGGSEGLIARST